MAIGQLAITPAIARVTAGDDWSLGFTLWDNGAVKSLTGATIQASVRDAFGNQIIAAVTQSSSATGATWASGVAVIVIPAASTAISAADCYLEIQATISGAKTTWPVVPLHVAPDGIA